jgi:hypothetical protein
LLVLFSFKPSAEAQVTLRDQSIAKSVRRLAASIPPIARPRLSAGAMSQQTADFPYFLVRDGFQSHLVVVNAISEPIEFVIAIHNLAGKTIQLPRKTVAPGNKMAFDISTLLTNQPEEIREEFSEGSVTVLYQQIRPMTLVGQITVSNAERHLVFESEMAMLMMGPAQHPQELNALWW